MHSKDFQDAITHFYQMLERAERGEETIITRAGKPVAKLVPYEEAFKPRSGGQWEGKVTISPTFDELPDEMTKAFGTRDGSKKTPS